MKRNRHKGKNNTQDTQERSKRTSANSLGVQFKEVFKALKSSNNGKETNKATIQGQGKKNREEEKS
jgi:multidrug efflux pump subunit AcrB